jgi:hypothetical protein
MQRMWAVATLFVALPVLTSAQTAGGTAPLDLGKAGLKATIQAPRGAVATEEFDSVFIRKSPRFAIEISQKDVPAFRKDVVSNDIQKLKKFYVDSPDTLLYETTLMGNHPFHFVVAVKVGAKKYTCEDEKGANTFTKADVDAMLKACESLKAN